MPASPWQTPAVCPDGFSPTTDDFTKIYADLRTAGGDVAHQGYNVTDVGELNFNAATGLLNMAGKNISNLGTLTFAAGGGLGSTLDAKTQNIINATKLAIGIATPQAELHVCRWVVDSPPVLKFSDTTATNNRGPGPLIKFNKAIGGGVTDSCVGAILSRYDPTLANVLSVRIGSWNNTDDYGATDVMLFSLGRVMQAAPNMPYTDASIGNSMLHFYLDEVGNNLKARVRYSNGTLKTATVALT